MALRNPCFKDQKLVSFEEEQTVERERGEEEEEKKRKRSQDQGQKGMELLALSMDPWFCLINGYLLYPNLGFVRISS